MKDIQAFPWVVLPLCTPFTRGTCDTIQRIRNGSIVTALFCPAGHGSTLLYSVLHLTGYDLTVEDLKLYHAYGSKTPGHPEYGHTPRH